MKKSKKLIRRILVGCLAAAYLLSNMEWLTIESQASTIQDEVLTDNFNSEELSDEWKENNAGIYSDYDAMRFNAAYNWAGAVILNAYQKQDYNHFVFDITVSDYRSSSWIGLAFGGESPTTSFGSFDGYIVMNATTISVVDLKNISASTNANAQSSPGLLKKMSKGSTTVDAIFAKGANGYDITLKFIFADKSELTYSWGGISITESNPYFALNSAYVLWDITDFKVLDSKEQVQFYDGFSKNTMTYSSENYQDGNWHINKNYTEKEIFVGPIAMAEFAKKDSKMVHKTPLKISTESECVYDISYLMRVEKFEQDSAFGIGLGLEKQKSKLDETAFCGIVKVDEEKGAFVLVKDGKIQKTASYFPLEKLHVGKGKFVEVSIKINYDFSVDFTIGKQKAHFSNLRYDGYWGIGNLDLKTKESSRILVDDMNVQAYDVVYYKSSDASNNFAGTKDEETDFGKYSEYYINKVKWFMGPRVSQKMYVEGEQEHGILFNRSSNYSYFGNREKYDEFVVQFDVVVNGLTDSMKNESYTGKEFNGQKFGISFGNSSFFKHSGLATTVGVYYVGTSADNVRSGIKGVNCTTDEGLSEVAITGSDIHFWKDDTTKYNFMYVVRDRSVEVYFKEDAQPMSELAICRAKFTNVDTDGYVMVYGSDNASFTLSNYRILNIGREATGNSNFSVREDFSKETISEQLKLNGSTSVKDEKLILKEGASVAVTEAGECYMMDFDVNEVNGSFEVKLTEDKSIVFDKNSSAIGFTENGNTTYIDTLQKRGFSNNDYTTKVALKFFGNEVGVYMLSEGESYDFIYKPVSTYCWQQNAGTLTPTIIAGEALTVDNLKVYRLDADYEAERINYDPQDEEVFEWEIKEEIADADDSSNSIVRGIVLGAIILVVVAGTVLVVIGLLRKKHKRGGANE